jgi:16S rRNA C1402 N4-methylase RsmH
MMDLMQGVEFSHWLFNNHLEKHDILIDATCGNGKDTLFLANKLTSEGKLYAFDIQKEPIKNTKNKVKENDLKSDIDYINDGHENIDKYVDESVDGIIYNLGFLPWSNKDIKTEKHTTITSLNKSLNMLNVGGLIVVVIYSEHEGGFDEKEAVLNFARKLNYKNYNVSHYHFINQKKTPPEVIAIKKRNGVK